MEASIKFILIFNGELVYNLMHLFNKHLLYQNGELKLDILYGKIYQFDEKQSTNIRKKTAFFLL
jgi:hypothetical protein